jgi:hypothetical protein
MSASEKEFESDKSGFGVAHARPNAFVRLSQSVCVVRERSASFDG